MAIVTFRMPVLEIEVEVDLEKYLPEGEMTEVNVNTTSMRVILDEAIKEALKSKEMRNKIGAFLSNSVFQQVKCKKFTFGHILPGSSFTVPLKLKI